MKIQQLLVETEEGVDFERFMKQMATECHHALSNGIVLYRGMQFNGNPYDKHHIRTDRRSLSEQYAETAIFNYAFEAVHGIKDVRNKCAFASTSKEDAAEYGAVHLIIPTNVSEIAFAPGVDDSMRWSEGWLLFTQRVKQLDPKFTPEELDHIDELSDALDYRQNITSDEFERHVSSLPERIRACMKSALVEQQRLVAETYQVAKPASLDPSKFGTGEIGTEVMIVAPYYYAVQLSWIVDRFGSIEGFTSHLNQMMGEV